MESATEAPDESESYISFDSYVQKTMKCIINGCGVNLPHFLSISISCAAERMLHSHSYCWAARITNTAFVPREKTKQSISQAVPGIHASLGRWSHPGMLPSEICAYLRAPMMYWRNRLPAFRVYHIRCSCNYGATLPHSHTTAPIHECALGPFRDPCAPDLQNQWQVVGH